MKVQPNKLFLNYIRKVLPFFTNDFNEILKPTACGILTDNKFYIDVSNDINIEVGDCVNITQLLFQYSYNSYTIQSKPGNGFYIRIVKNGIDKEIGTDTMFFLSVEDDIIMKSYYPIEKIEYDAINNKTVIYILVNENKYFQLKDCDPQKQIQLYTDYGNSLSGYNGLKEVEENTQVTIAGISYNRLTFSKDTHFNFTVNDSDLSCEYTKLHYDIRIQHAIPKEFMLYGIQQYIQKKQNIMLINIENGRSNDGSFEYYQDRNKSTYIPMIYRVEIHLFFYRNLFEDESVTIKPAALYDNITDVMQNATTHIIQACSLYQEVMNKKIEENTIGGLQNVNRISTPSYNPLGNIDGNMQHYLLTMDAEGSIFTFNPDILQEQFVIKEIQSNIFFKTF